MIDVLYALIHDFVENGKVSRPKRQKYDAFGFIKLQV
jgi:hypothetical protein